MTQKFIFNCPRKNNHPFRELKKLLTNHMIGLSNCITIHYAVGFFFSGLLPIRVAMARMELRWGNVYSVLFAQCVYDISLHNIKI